MRYDQFIGQVQSRAKLQGKEQAVAAVRSTLETLAERITPGAADNLASQLPREIGEYLRHSPTGPITGGERFGMKEFIERVREREHAEAPEAAYHARVVLEVLREAITPGEIAHIQSQFPEDMRELFSAGSQGNLKNTKRS